MSQLLKRELKDWERSFQLENGRKPLKPDIDVAGPVIASKYKQYSKLVAAESKQKQRPTSTLTKSFGKKKYLSKVDPEDEDDEVIGATPVKKPTAGEKSPRLTMKQPSIFGRHLNKCSAGLAAGPTDNPAHKQFREVDDFFGDQLDRQIGRGNLSRELGNIQSPRNRDGDNLTTAADNVCTPIKLFKKTHFGQGPLDFVSPKLRPGQHVGLGACQSPFQPRFMSPRRQQYLLRSPALIIAERKLEQEQEMNECMKELENDENDDDCFDEEPGGPPAALAADAIVDPVKTNDLEYAVETVCYLGVFRNLIFNIHSSNFSVAQPGRE